MIYGYCIRRGSDPSPRPGLEGIDGVPVSLRLHGALGMWVSELAAAAPPTEERLRAHEQVVLEALRSATPLPLRFGSTFPSETAADRALEEGAERFERTLSRVSGLVEMGVRVEWREVPPVRPALPKRADSPSGRAYLERRKAEIVADVAARDLAGQIVEEVEAEVRNLADRTASGVILHGPVLGNVACLVRRADVASFRGRVEALPSASRQDVRLAISGPWAPYSFVND